MPAGDLVTEPYHLELRGKLHGPSTPIHWGTSGWAGLGHNVKSQDVDLDQADGAVAGRDYLTSKVLTFPAEFGGTGPANVMLELGELLEAWKPSVVDLELHAWLPGWEHFYVVGRPRGLTEDLSAMPKGEGRALLTFVAADPTIVFVP